MLLQQHIGQYVQKEWEGDISHCRPVQATRRPVRAQLQQHMHNAHVL